VEQLNKKARQIETNIRIR